MIGRAELPAGVRKWLARRLRLSTVQDLIFRSYWGLAEPPDRACFERMLRLDIRDLSQALAAPGRIGGARPA